MTDLTQLLSDIRNPEKTHVDLYKRHGKGTLQWFLEKDCATHPIHNNNRLEFFMCGQEGFAAIQADILAADTSIDLVLWGFDPGMELVRGAGPWPRGTTYGDLLTARARAGVQVRLLVWYEGNIVAGTAANVADIGLLSPVTLWELPDELKAPSTAGMGLTARLEARRRYCNTWWTMALRNRFANLEVRLRKANPISTQQNIRTYLRSSATAMELESMVEFPTHHQKPVLIDYAAKGKAANTCGYVMGLNSVTDYWDTPAHRFNDPLREDSAAGAWWREIPWRLKPYRDYAIRVRGEALHNLNENFVQGWDHAEGYGLRNGASIFGASLEKARRSIRPQDLPVPPGASHRAQVLRTFPDKGDATILKAYTLASSNAINYIYVENQYFQLTDWARLLKAIRQRYRDGMAAAGAKMADLSTLHVIVVTPQPERGQMVPATYDTLSQLGQGTNMAAYDKQVQGERKPQAATNPLEAARRAIAKASLDASPTDAVGELETLGIKTLAVMLMTYDDGNEAKDIRISARDSDALQAQAEREAGDNAAAKAHQGKANDVDPTDYSGYDIQPGRYREIYIHSKLMFVDDVYTTVGSANLNVRSMAGDSEFNICTEDPGFTREARRRVWGNLAGMDLDGGTCTPKECKEVKEKWLRRMLMNKAFRGKGLPPVNGSFIHPFEDPRGTPIIRLG